MYVFVQKDWGVSVWYHGEVVCLIDDAFAVEAGYGCALEYCKYVFTPN